jgi:predicted ATPase
VLLVLDDVQWADAPTLLLLRHLVQACGSAPLLIVVTARDDEPTSADLRALLVDLWRRRTLDRISLGGLDAEETAELLAALRPGAAGIAACVCADTGGNPFLIEELVSEARADDVPAAVRDMIECRLERLPDRAPELLALAAAAGGSFHAGELAEHASVPVRIANAALAAARAVGLVVEVTRGSGRHDFRRPLDRRAVLAAAATVPSAACT